jgi:hypothetical protein
MSRELSRDRDSSGTNATLMSTSTDAVPLATAVPLVQGAIVLTGEVVKARAVKAKTRKAKTRRVEKQEATEAAATTTLLELRAPQTKKWVREGRRRLQLGKVARDLVERLKSLQAGGGIEIEWREDATRECMREVARVAFTRLTFGQVEEALLPCVRASKPRYAQEVVRGHFRNAGLVPEGCDVWANPDLKALRALVHSDEEMRRRDAMYAKQITRFELQAERRRKQQARAAEQYAAGRAAV